MVVYMMVHTVEYLVACILVCRMVYLGACMLEYILV